jgi:hypothetical protein
VEISLVADTRIGSAEFGEYHYQQFLGWSFCDRQSKAALLRNLAVARTDANQESIDRKIAFYAKLYRLTSDELLERIRLADEQKISIAKLHETLAKEAGLSAKEASQVPTDTSY